MKVKVRRRKTAEKAWEEFKRYYMPVDLCSPESERSKSMADLIDASSGTKLTPSYHGKECQGNGSWPEHARCCDGCSYFLNCFPESNDPDLRYHYGDRRDFWRPIIREDTCLECKHRDRKTENKPRLLCHKTKRYGRDLRGNRCPYFEKEE